MAEVSNALSMTAGKLYRRALTAHWPIYLAGVATLLATSATEVLTPKFIQWAIDLVSGHLDPTGLPAKALATPGDPRATLGTLVFWLGVVLVVGLVGRIGWRQLLARRTHIEGRRLKVEFWDALRFLPLRTFQDYPLGD